MKNISYLLLCVMMLLVTACEKDTMPATFAPEVTTGTATNIYRKGATLSGTIDNVETTVLERYGILFSELKSMVEYKELSVDTGEKDFEFLVQDLKPGATYYFCAFAYSGYSMVKGEIRSFTTSESNAPVFSDLKVMDYDSNSISLSTEILDDGGSELMLSGFCWIEGEGKMPTFIDHIKNVEAENMNLSVVLSDLTPNTVYRVRAYAATSKGVGYSDVVTVRTGAAIVPTLADIVASDSTMQSITVASHVNDLGTGSLTEVGFCYSTNNANPNKDEHSTITTAIPSGHDEFKTTIEGLVAGTTYYIRAYASNEYGTGYSSETFAYTPTNPGIYNLQDLMAFCEANKNTGDYSPWIDGNGVINIYSDIDLSSISNWEPIENIPDEMILDGNGHTITGMKMSYIMSSNNYGFIRMNHGTVRNLNLGRQSQMSFAIETESHKTCRHGALCAYNFGIISDCSSEVMITSTLSSGVEIISPDEAPAIDYVAGICGENAGSVIRCINKGDITGGWHCDGIVGYNRGLVEDCQNYGTIIGVEFSQSISGIAGCSEESAIINNCTNYGKIVGNGTYYVGGISGGIYGIVENCSNQGEVTGSGVSVGGIVGDMYSGSTLRNCTNMGVISNDGTGESITYYGGIVGWIHNAWDSGESVHVYLDNKNGGTVLGASGDDTNAIGRDDRVGKPGFPSIEDIPNKEW